MPEIVFRTRLEAAGNARTRIYAVPRPNVNRAGLLAFAETIGVEPKGGTLSQDPVKLTYANGPHLVTQFKASGAVRYQDLTRWQVDDGESNVDIPDDEAARLGLELIGKYELAPQKECQLLKVSRLMVGAADVKEREGRERAIDIGVAFQRTIGGVPVDGPGGKVIVYLDRKGELTGFDRIWRPLGDGTAVKEYRGTDAIDADLQRYWKANGDGRIEVTEQRFGYFELGYGALQKVIQPAYVLLLTLTGPDERVRMGSAHVFPAASNAVGTLMPVRKAAAVQEPRPN